MDHPRTRGEHLYKNGGNVHSQGSPPHTRGTSKISCAIAFQSRITPAHAGNIVYEPPKFLAAKDHPRTRGEHSKFCSGKRVILRITPAHAGNIHLPKDRLLPVWDHPRTRGEHVNDDIKIGRVFGSPPHTRGTSCAHTSIATSSGITPAHAGNICNLALL